MRWERLAAVRSPFMVLVGLGFLCVAAFMWTPVAGWAAIGVGLILLAYLTDGAPAESGQQGAGVRR